MNMAHKSYVIVTSDNICNNVTTKYWGAHVATSELSRKWNAIVTWYRLHHASDMIDGMSGCQRT